MENETIAARMPRKREDVNENSIFEWYDHYNGRRHSAGSFGRGRNHHSCGRGRSHESHGEGRQGGRPGWKNHASGFY